MLQGGISRRPAITIFPQLAGGERAARADPGARGRPCRRRFKSLKTLSHPSEVWEYYR